MTARQTLGHTGGPCIPHLHIIFIAYSPGIPYSSFAYNLQDQGRNAEGQSGEKKSFNF